MTGTTAVSLDLIIDSGRRRPLCPACTGGLLQPFHVSVPLGGFNHADYGDAWVAVCVGSKPSDPDEPGMAGPVEPCGFSVPLQPHYTSC